VESEQFDALVRETYEGATRRGVVGVGVGALAVSALGVLGLRGEADAKKKKKKKGCKGDRPVKCGGGCCSENYPQCCDDAYLTSGKGCNPAGFTCCPLENGGGSCSPNFPLCCPAVPEAPYGYCCPTGNDCCETDDDCEIGVTCVAGCCGLLVAESAAKSSRSAMRSRVKRFHKAAK
jgi:hypothetical protein